MPYLEDQVIRGLFIFLCGIAAGALLYDTALERANPAPTLTQWVESEPQRPLILPLQPDATVQLCGTSYNCDEARRYFVRMK